MGLKSVRLRTGGLAAALALLAAAGLTAACRDRALRGTPPNILLIAVDTLRADKLGAYGNTRGLTPHIDALAAAGARFAQASSNAPWTLPSFASLLTSTLPAEHGAGMHDNRLAMLAPHLRTLAETLRPAGYATGAIINVDFLSERFGMDRGYAKADYDADFPADNVRMRDATATTDAAIRRLQAHTSGRFFLMVHYFDPHLVYDPPPEFRRRFASPEDRERGSFMFGTREQITALRRGELKLDPAVIHRAAQLYDGEVAYVDDEIGRLLAEVARLGLDDSTLVVFTADHGEEFLDHGEYEHGHSLYEELLHVPLILRLPRRIAPGVIDQPVQLIDVAPTLCEFAHTPPAPTFGGRSLLPLLAGRPEKDRTIVASSNLWGPPMSSVRRGRYKLIFVGRRALLFDLATDPGERSDLSSTDWEHRQELARYLAQVLEVAQARRKLGHDEQAQKPQLQDEEKARLRSLGYVGAMTGDATVETPPPEGVPNGPAR